MLIPKVYYNNQLLDIDDEFKFAIDLDINDIENIDIRKVGKSTVIKVPATKNNKKVLENLDSNLVAKQNIESTARFEVGSFIFSGVCKYYESISINNLIYYQIQIVADSKDWLDALTNLNLTDVIDYSDYDHIVNETNVSQSWTTNTIPYKYIIPAHTIGSTVTSFINPTTNFIRSNYTKPAIKYNDIFNNLINYTGNKIESNWLTSSLIDNTYLWNPAKFISAPIEKSLKALGAYYYKDNVYLNNNRLATNGGYVPNGQRANFYISSSGNYPTQFLYFPMTGSSCETYGEQTPLTNPTNHRDSWDYFRNVNNWTNLYSSSYYADENYSCSLLQSNSTASISYDLAMLPTSSLTHWVAPYDCTADVELNLYFQVNNIGIQVFLDPFSFNIGIGKYTPGSYPIDNPPLDWYGENLYTWATLGQYATGWHHRYYNYNFQFKKGDTVAAWLYGNMVGEQEDPWTIATFATKQILCETSNVIDNTTVSFKGLSPIVNSTLIDTELDETGARSDKYETFYFKVSNVQQMSSSISVGDTLKVNQLITDIKCTDFINDSKKCFNLNFYTNPYEKKVYIEPYDSFYLDKSIDWTSKLDTEKDISVTNLQNYKTINFKGAADEGSTDYDFIQYSSNTLYDKELTIQNQFITNQGLLPGNTILPFLNSISLPSCPNTIEDGDIIIDENTKPRLLTFNGMVTSSAWMLGETSMSQIPTVTGYVYSDGNNSETIDLLYRTYKYYPIVVPDYNYYQSIGSRTGYIFYYGSDNKQKYIKYNNWYDSYYLMQQLTLTGLVDGKRIPQKLVCYITLNNNDLNGFINTIYGKDFRTPVYFDQNTIKGHYIVQKIEKYDPLTPDSTKVTLIKLINKQIELNG